MWKETSFPSNSILPKLLYPRRWWKDIKLLKDHFDEYYILLKKLLNISNVCAICACHTTTKILIVVEHQRFSYLGSWQMDNNSSLISCPDAPFFSHSLAFFPIITDCISETKLKFLFRTIHIHTVSQKRTTLNHPLPWFNR